MMDLISAILLDWVVLTLSFYNAISVLWLGLMVLLIGNRRTPGTWLTGAGFLLGALFFTSHTAIMGRGLVETGLGMNFWWWISWAPALAAPLAWYGSMLWYTGYRANRPHPQRFWLLSVCGLVLLIIFLLIFANPVPTYQYVAGQVALATPSVGSFPLLILAYLVYSFLCYLLPLGLFGRVLSDSSMLEQHSREQARPWLMGASIAMLLAALLLALVAAWALTTVPALSLSIPHVAEVVKEFDVAISGLVALAVTLLGRAIVAYEVFTGRPLPRDRFLSQWRSTVIVAGGFGAVVSLILVAGLRPIYILMLATALMTMFFALSSWRTFADREAFMARLRPFLASQNLYERLTSPAEQLVENTSDASARRLFETLCTDLLGTQAGALVPLGRLEALVGPPLRYPRGATAPLPDAAAWGRRFSPELRCLPTGDARLAWAVPLWTQNVLAGLLFLGPKRGSGPYSEEEIELAQAGGERLLDVLAGSELARLSLDLLRQRLMEARVLEGRGRRVLHDEVLPELHTAALYLSAAGEDNSDAVAMLAAAHRRISDLLRASSPDLPASLARDGLAVALRGLVAVDFSSEFNCLDWQIEPRAEAQARALQPLAAEAVYFAVRELVRNAARYGRGSEPGCQLTLTIRMESNGERLRILIQDDGVGLGSRAGLEGAGSGLRIHSAMLAAVGGSLEISAVEPHGACAAISV